jgi:hypothetical protein
MSKVCQLMAARWEAWWMVSWLAVGDEDCTMLAAPCTTWPPVGKALTTGVAQAKPTQTIDKTTTPMKTDTAEPGATASPAGDSPDDLPWLQACSPTATRQPKCSEKTVLKQRAFIGNKAMGKQQACLRRSRQIQSKIVKFIGK